MRALSAIALAVALALASACGSADRAAIETVQVTAADTACTVDRAEVPAGTIELAVTNHGTIITEVYLYGARDRPLGEVENVEPGTSASFTVTAGGGVYEVACKPGQLGDGVRAPLRIVGGRSSTDDAPVDEATARGVSAFAFDVHVSSDRFAAELADLVVVEGQTITFRLHNEADIGRGLVVLGPDGATVGATDAAAPGAVVTLRVTFAATGTYTAVDPTGDHRAQGAEVTFRVIA